MALTIDNAKKLEKELNKALEELKKKDEGRYVVDVSELYPTAPPLDRIKYTGLSDEELRKKVEDELGTDIEKGRQKMYDDLDSAIKNLSKGTEGLSEYEQKQLKLIGDTYKSIFDNIGNSAIKKGIARSSIIGEQMKEGISDKNQKEKEVKDATASKISEIQMQIDDLEGGIESAVADYDISSAKKMQTKVDTLKKEQEKLEEQALKYNNDIAQKEGKIEENRKKAMNLEREKRYDEVDTLKRQEFVYEKEYNDYYGDKKINYTARYDKALDFYSQATDKRIALALIKSNVALESYLGIYYRKLLRSFGG